MKMNTTISTIDLNADLGEGQGTDAQLMDIISSASIACGGHAGDETSMRKTLLSAKNCNVAVGAHPGFLDKSGFGRVKLDIAPEIVAQQVVDQVSALSAIADEVAHPIRYVKLHGALYNWASMDEDFARVAFTALKVTYPHLSIMALDNSVQLRVANELEMTTIAEAFVDRRYTDRGLLVDRSKNGAVIEEAQDALQQALGIALDKSICTADGAMLPCHAQSLCLHGDNVAALELARKISQGLQEAGIEIKAPQ